MNAEERERRLERLMHQIAAHLHFQMAAQDITVRDLEGRLGGVMSRRAINGLLRAEHRYCHRLRLDTLSDIALAVGGAWDFRCVAARAAAVPADQTAELDAQHKAA